jgi:hypothetical protein
MVTDHCDQFIFFLCGKSVSKFCSGIAVSFFFWQVNMSYRNADVQKVLPENKVHWKLAFCPKRRVLCDEYRISIECDDYKRQYSCVTFEELSKLIREVPSDKRCFYEHISREDCVKFYVDFEYQRTDRNALVDSRRALSSIQILFIGAIKKVVHPLNVCVDNMLVLCASSSQKESYHLIFTDKRVRFSSTLMLRLFIEQTLRSVLLEALGHICCRQREYSGQEISRESSLSEIINAFDSVRLEWFLCVHCQLKETELTVNDVCHLLVDDGDGQLIPTIDMKVYGIEQDFRMLMCTKLGDNRPLRMIDQLESQFSCHPIQSNHR